MPILPLLATALLATSTPASIPTLNALDTTVVDSLGPDDDRSPLGGRRRVHALTLARGQRVHLLVRSSSFDPTLVVALDDTVHAFQFQARDDGATARTAHVDVVAPVEGRYLVAVGATADDARGTFTLVAQRGTAAESTAHTVAESRPLAGAVGEAIALGGAVHDSLPPGGSLRKGDPAPTRRHALALHAGDSVTVELSATDFAPTLGVGLGTASAELLLVVGSSTAARGAATITFVAPLDGTYTLLVGGENAARGAYRLAVRRVDADATGGVRSIASV